MSGDGTNPTKYNFPYRTNYEAYLLLTWLVAAAIMVALPYLFDLPKLLYQITAGTCVIIGLVTGHRAIEIYIKVKRLKGYPVEVINPISNETMKMFGLSREVINRVNSNRK